MKRRTGRTHFEAGFAGLAMPDSLRRIERAAVGRVIGRVARRDWPRMDYVLATTIGALLVVGLMMVYSSTFDTMNQAKGQPAWYLLRQLAFAGLGLALLIALARLDYAHLHRVSVPLLGVVIVLLILVLLVGQDRYGARRSFASGSLQPSELAKLAVVIYIADWLASKGDKIRDVSYGLVPFGVLVGGIGGLIVMEPDFSTAALIVFTAATMFFVAGAEWAQILGGGAIAAVTFGLLVMSSEHGKERVGGFIQMLLNPEQAGWQIQQSFTSIGSGGLFGRGLGAGRLKLGYLPLGHTDSIFAVIGEETGLVGTLIVVALFAVLAYRGFKIAAQAPDVFGALLATGATSWLVYEAAFNVAAVTGLMPFTGIPLPFVSYGGSSLVACMGAAGVLLSVSRGTRKRARQNSAAMDLGRRDGRPRLSRARSR